MELQIFSDRFVIEYAPVWVALLLMPGLIFFFISKSLREYYKKNYKYSFVPGVIFIVSFIFLIGGINLFVYKIVFNKDGLTVFNIHNFNKQINWQTIEKVRFLEQQKIEITFLEPEQTRELMLLNLKELPAESMDKVKILLRVKLKQYHKTMPEFEPDHNFDPSAPAGHPPLPGVE